MTAKTNTAERRKYPRVARILSIQYRLKKSVYKEADKTTWYNSSTHDMSVDGVAFMTDRSFMVGDILELQVVMSGILSVVSAEGKIVRIEDKKRGKYLIGMQLKKYF